MVQISRVAGHRDSARTCGCCRRCAGPRAPRRRWWRSCRPAAPGSRPRAPRRCRRGPWPRRCRRACSAGASLTPSPVIATNSPCACSASRCGSSAPGRRGRRRARRARARSAPSSSAASSAPVSTVLARIARCPRAQGDGPRRRRVVAGDHHRRDAGVQALAHRGGRFGAAGRSARPARAGSGPPPSASMSSSGKARSCAPRQRQHAQALRGHAFGLPRPRAASSGRGLRSAARTAGRPPRARPWCRRRRPPASRWYVVMRLRSASNGSSATRGSRPSSASCRRPAARRLRQRGFGRVALPAAAGCAAARRCTARGAQQLGWPAGAASPPGMPASPSSGSDLRAHPVLRERAGLVGADVGDRAQRLHRGRAGAPGACDSTIRRAPSASSTVTTAGSASGMPRPPGSPRSGTSAAAARRAAADHEHDRADRQHGDRQPLAERGQAALQRRGPGRPRASRPAILPSSVAMPVATTRPRPRPCVAVVPLKAMLRRSPSACRSPSRHRVLGDGHRLAGQRRFVDLQLRASISRRSAGTWLPASSSTMSPGTSSCAATCAPAAARTTTACAAPACAARPGPVGAPGLHDADGGVEHDDHDDHERVDPVAQARDHRGADQHQDHQVAELVGHQATEAARRRAGSSLGPWRPARGSAPPRGRSPMAGSTSCAWATVRFAQVPVAGGLGSGRASHACSRFS